MTRFTEALAIPRYTLYMQDHGGPVGFRMALAHPERVEAVIVQDAVSHNEGLGSNWKTRHVGNDPHIDRYDPDLWTDEFAFLSQPGQIDIRTELFYNYRANVESYQNGRHGCANTSPGSSCFGASTILRLIHLNPRPIAATSPTPKCMCWVLVISPWTPPLTRSQHWSAVSCGSRTDF
jgi:pimeloyl-ACP methyl ester carboxylesterase